MACCGCSRVKPKPPLWQEASLLVVLLPLFSHPLVLLTGQTNCPQALSDQQGSSSPETPGATLVAGKSAQTKTKPLKRKHRRIFWCWLMLYCSDAESIPHLHDAILPDDHAPVAGFCFAGAPLTKWGCWCHKTAVQFLFWSRCAGVWISVQHFLLIINNVTAQTSTVSYIHEH